MDKSKIYNQHYYQKNKERISKYSIKYYEKNKEKINKYSIKYYYNNTDKWKYQYRLPDPEKQQEKNEKQQEKNEKQQEKIRIRQERRRKFLLKQQEYNRLRREKIIEDRKLERIKQNIVTIEPEAKLIIIWND